MGADAVDAIRVGRQPVDPQLALQRQRTAQQELGRPAAAAGGPAAVDRHRRLAAGKDHAGPRKGLAVPGHGARQRRMHAADNARLAFDLVAQDVGRQPLGARRIGRRLQAHPRRGQHHKLVAGQALIAGLGRLEVTALQPGAGGGRQLDAVAAADGQRVGAGRGIGHRGAGGDHGRVVAGHITDRDRQHPSRRTGRRQPPALDRRQVLAHAVHFVDGRAAGEQRPVHRLLVGQGQAGRGQAQQRRAAAGDQADDQVVRGQAAGEVQQPLAGGQARGIRHRVRRLGQLDPPRPPAARDVAVAGDDEARQRRLRRPGGLQRLHHRATGLARTQHQGAAFWWGRQLGRQHLAGQRPGDRHVVELAQQRARVEGHGCCVQRPISARSSSVRPVALFSGMARCTTTCW
mmetsp:Transcript_10043/g.40906  ORF Transcript_10043/g.40906 Transcript_10043/m.40906 type:complete len:403 (-) Transcript_10043:865-2073(-)